MVRNHLCAAWDGRTGMGLNRMMACRTSCYWHDCSNLVVDSVSDGRIRAENEKESAKREQCQATQHLWLRP